MTTPTPTTTKTDTATTTAAPTNRANRPAPLVSWRELQVWSLDGALLDRDDALDALGTYRRNGAMAAWLVDPSGYGPDGAPRSGEGPELHEAGPSRYEIDWAGFDAAYDPHRGTR